MFHRKNKTTYSSIRLIDRNCRNSGFTLVEVIVAMGVLLCFAVTICTLEVLAFRNSRTLYHDVIANQILGDLMREARYTLDKIPANQAGERTVDGITYKWVLQFNKTDDKKIEENFREVRAECTWSDQTGNHRRTRHSMVTFSEIRESEKN